MLKVSFQKKISFQNYWVTPELPIQNQWNLLLYLLDYAEACNKFVEP